MMMRADGMRCLMTRQASMPPRLHPDIHDDDVGQGLLGQVDRLVAVGRLPDHVDSVFRREHGLEPAPVQRVVVDDEHSDDIWGAGFTPLGRAGRRSGRFSDVTWRPPRLQRPDRRAGRGRSTCGSDGRLGLEVQDPVAPAASAVHHAGPVGVPVVEEEEVVPHELHLVDRVLERHRGRGGPSRGPRWASCPRRRSGPSSTGLPVRGAGLRGPSGGRPVLRIDPGGLCPTDSDSPAPAHPALVVDPRRRSMSLSTAASRAAYLSSSAASARMTGPWPTGDLDSPRPSASGHLLVRHDDVDSMHFGRQRRNFAQALVQQLTESVRTWTRRPVTTISTVPP